jgi:hydroxymethylpyrimidine pyrophosphatase-like HAD family hydrolase
LGAEHRGTKNGLAFDLGAFDLDGTVLRRNLRITQGTVAALQNLKERGMRLVVATGRRFEDAREYAGRLGFADHDPLICYGGSMVRRINGETLLHRKLPGSLGIEEPERVLAFGDADNDIDMLRFAGHGVAVGGMTGEVREAADRVVPGVDEDGVAGYVETLLGRS